MTFDKWLDVHTFNAAVAEMVKYNKEAVDKAIERNLRREAEAKLIHRLLKGRRKKTTKEAE